MKKILLSLICVLTAAISLSAAERESEVNVVVGHSIDTHPAGSLLLGATPVEGGEFVKVNQIGSRLHIEGVKVGKATYQLSLRYNQSMTLRINVVARSFSTAEKPVKPEKPQWTGTYELKIPRNHFCISFAYTKSSGEEDSEITWARIDDIVVHSQCDYDEGWWIFGLYDYDTSLGYSGGFNDENEFKYYLADGSDSFEAGRDWFDEYAPHPAGSALDHEPPTWFGWDNNGDPDIPTGIVMQRMRQFGRAQSYLNKFYCGEEEVFGIQCWVFDMRGKGNYGVGDLCWWIDPATGLALKYLAEDGSGMVVKTYDLDYRAWDAFARPELF